MDIAYCMTRNLYPAFRKVVRSVLFYNDANIHVIAEDKDIGFDCGVVEYHAEDFKVDYDFTKMCYARMMLPNLLKEDKVLYLDVDTIVCDSLQELWDTDLEGKWFGAVPERGHWNPWERDYYFNAGVLLMNLKQMRKDKAPEQIVQAINTGEYRFGEQDVMNHLFYDKIVRLPLRYNESAATGETSDPAIVHFAGVRGWEKGKYHRCEYRDKWFCP